MHLDTNVESQGIIFGFTSVNDTKVEKKTEKILTGKK